MKRISSRVGPIEIIFSWRHLWKKLGEDWNQIQHVSWSNQSKGKFNLEMSRLDFPIEMDWHKRRKRVRDHFSRICNDKNSDQKKFSTTKRPYIHPGKGRLSTMSVLFWKTMVVSLENKESHQGSGRTFFKFSAHWFQSTASKSYQTIKNHQSRVAGLQHFNPRSGLGAYGLGAD